MKWVGHSDLRMIIHYCELQDAESRKAMETLGASANFGQSGTIGGRRNRRARNSLSYRSLRAQAEQLVEDRGVEPLASRMPF